MLSAARAAFEGHIPPFVLRGARFTIDGGPVEFVEPAAKRAVAVQEAPSSVLVPPVPAKVETPVPALPTLAQVAALRADVDALNARLEEGKAGKGQSALALSVRLKRLREAHNVHPMALPLPLGPPCEAKAMRIRAIAATADLDLDRARFLPGCWPALDASRIKLLMSHDEAREVGTIDEISVDALGRVLVIATVTDPFAMRMPAMSISAAIERFTLRNSDSRDFVGEIETVRDVNECSLTTTPSNPNCLVLERWIPDPVSLSFDAMIRSARRMQEIAQRLKAA